jgi:hypothetical protein
MRLSLFSVLPSLAAVMAAYGQSPDHWTLAEKEQFLTHATIVSEEPISKGITKPKKAMLTDGHRTHAAHIQTVDIYMPLFKGVDGSEERDFKDTWKFNVAAYRLAKLLGITNMVPVSVARVVDGKPAAVTWWVDNLLMDERERVNKNISPPDPVRWRDEMDTVRTFDQLIYNVDRSQDNLLISSDWTAWMIDHTRAFRKWQELRNSAMITTCNAELFRALKNLTRAALDRELSPYLTDEEISGLLARRDLIVALLAAHSSPQRSQNEPAAYRSARLARGASQGTR